MPIPMFLAKQALKSAFKEVIKPKPLNEGEDEILEELQDPDSPLSKDVEDWDNGDLARAFESPSYKHNAILQRKVDKYIQTKW